MACNLSAGRNEVCKESIGGIQGVYFVNYTTGSFTKNGAGEVTAVPSGSVLYFYSLKGSSAASPPNIPNIPPKGDSITDSFNDS